MKNVLGTVWEIVKCGVLMFAVLIVGLPLALIAAILSEKCASSNEPEDGSPPAAPPVNCTRYCRRWTERGNGGKGCCHA